MKNTSKLWGFIAFVAVIGFSFASCDQNINDDDNKKLPAGKYNTTSAEEAVYVGNQNNVTAALTQLNTVTSPSFTVNDDGVITDLSLGSFLAWASGAVVQYRFTLSGNVLNFQVKEYGANDFTAWGKAWTSGGSNVEYKQRIDGNFSSGVVRLTLRYQRTDNQGSAYRTYELKKQ